MQSYRRRNFLQDGKVVILELPTATYCPTELHKLGEAARGTLFIQLAAFPSHYLVIVITDMEYQYALISTSVIPGSMFGNMVMEDIAWLDLSRIHGDEAVRAASTTTPNDHPLNGSSKRKRSQDRPADLHSSSRGYVDSHFQIIMPLSTRTASTWRPPFYESFIATAGELNL